MDCDPDTTALDAARAGAAAATEWFRRDVEIETKAHKNDLVSAADRAAQERVFDTIRAASDAPIRGEEGDGETAVPPTGPAWIVDPIDGTANFLRGVPLWGTSVAAVEDGEPVGAATVLPALDDVFVTDGAATRRNGETVTLSDRADPETFAVGVLGWGPHGNRGAYATLSREVIERCGDMRRFGSMQATLAFVAAGGLEAAITTRHPNPWDSVAGVHMIRQAGGTVTDLAGDRWRHDSVGLVASNGVAHDAIQTIARDVAAEAEQ